MHQLALTCDGAMDLGAILQFNSNCLMAELHQKPVGWNEESVNSIPSGINKDFWILKQNIDLWLKLSLNILLILS